MLHEGTILIIDELTLLHRKVIEAVDNTHDIRSSIEIMGGLLTLLCGDFRQILPVAPHRTRSNIIDACLKSSYLWPSVTSFQLTTNMMVLLNADEGVQTFSEDLLCIGNGLQQIEAAPDYISIHHFGKQCADLKSLCDHIYPSLDTNFVSRDWLMQRAILAPPQ